MAKFPRNLIAAIWISTSAVGSSHAAMTTWSFIGTVLPNSTHDVGQIIAGSLTFDPLLTNFVLDTDGGSYQIGTNTFYPPYTSPRQLSGSARIGSENFIIGGGDDFDMSSVSVRKNGTDNLNNYGISGQSKFHHDAGAGTVFGLYVFDYMGSFSSIFFDSGAGLNFDQAVNWTANGAEARLNLLFEDRFYFARLTSVVVTTATPYGVPEPGSLSLLCSGLVGLVVKKRRKAS